MDAQSGRPVSFIGDPSLLATTATSPVSITTSTVNPLSMPPAQSHQLSAQSSNDPLQAASYTSQHSNTSSIASGPPLGSVTSAPTSVPLLHNRSRSRTKRRLSGSTAASSTSPSSERGLHKSKETESSSHVIRPLLNFHLQTSPSETYPNRSNWHMCP
jgi:hypothetical protein